MNNETALNLAQTLMAEAPDPSEKADAIATTLEQARSGSAPAVPAMPGPVSDATASGKVETRGRHKKGCQCPTCSAKAIGAKSSGKTTAVSDPYTAPAIALVGTLTGMAQMSIDPAEWKPEPAETDFMVRAWHDQFEKSGITTFPPIAAIALATLGYILPRLSRPKTATRFERVIAWLKGRKSKPADTEKTEK